MAAYIVTCKPTEDHPQLRTWGVEAPNAGIAQERVMMANNLTWSHIQLGLISTRSS